MFAMFVQYLFGRWLNTKVVTPENDPEPFSENMATRITTLSGLLKTQLPEATIPENLATRTESEIREILEDVLVDTGFLNARQALVCIDPRIRLVIDNKEEEELPVHVHVHDQGWTGSPTLNTMIVAVRSPLSSTLQKLDVDE